MKKIALYLLALFSLSIYLLSMNSSFMKYFVKDWNNSKRPEFLHSDKYKYGDLYGLSYLPAYRIPVGGTYNALVKGKPSDNDSVGMWIIGDSFLETAFRTDSGKFKACGVTVEKFYWYGNDKEPAELNFGQYRKKILLIEMNERFISHELHPQNTGKLINCFQTGKREESGKPSSSITASIVPKNIEQNIETILFGYEMFAAAKNAKAELSGLTGIQNDMVYESKEQKRLFLRSTVDANSAASSFHKTDSKTVNGYIESALKIREAYLAKGFDEVVFSFVPNAVSITPEKGMTYNYLIQRLETNCELGKYCVKVYDAMNSSPERNDLYWKSDTHWNAKGFAIWQKSFTAKMKEVKQGRVDCE